MGKQHEIDVAGSDRVERFLGSNAGFLEPDPQIMRNHRMSPRTPREEQALAACTDPHVLREVSSRMISVLDESFEISEQTVAAPAGKFADLATAYMTASGDISLLSNRGVAGFATVLHYPVKFILKYFKDDPSVSVRDGDAFIQNDARYGGLHSPDQGMMMPVFYEGELIAWSICSLHEGEIGARPPGGMGPSIESPYEEGFRGSPMKIVENDMLKTDLVTLLQNSCREPRTMLVDLRARLATCIRLKKQLLAAVEEYGLDTVIASLRQTPEFVAEETRRRLQELPDGTVRTTLYSDSTMREPCLMKLEIALSIQDGRMILDLRGSSPEIANRPINTPVSAVSGAVLMATMHFIWPDLPKSPALVEHLEVLTDPKSIYNASYDVPIALNMHAAFKVITATEVLFAKLQYGLPQKYAQIKAPWYNQPAGMMYGGETQHGNTVGNVCADLNGMGGGAREHLDGEHSLGPNFSAMVDCGESEFMEEFLPYVNFVSKHLEPDTGSFGKHRGGQGYQMTYVRHGKQPFGFQTIVGGSKFPSVGGLFGGYGCASYPVAKVKSINLFEHLKEHPGALDATMASVLNKRPFRGATYESAPYNMEFELAYEGEMYMTCQGAGGGYGDVLERDPELVMKDLAEGLISRETARELYRVVFNEQNLVVDVQATAQARRDERQARIARGMSYKDFIQAKMQKAPPRGVLYFGNWNRSEEVYGGMFKARPGEFPTPIYLPDPKDIMKATLQQKLVSADDEPEDADKPELARELASAFSPQTAARFVSIMGAVGWRSAKAAALYSRLKMGPAGPERDSRMARGLGKILADFLHDAGPTFIKLGQVLSNRPDLLPPETIKELSFLQDNVAPMPFSTVKRVIEADLGRPLNEIYQSLEEQALAAGSVAQVHRATLQDGRVAAVKVRREGLEDSFNRDLSSLSVIARLAMMIPGVSKLGMIEIIDEFGRSLHRQIDFPLEIANNRKLAETYAHFDWVRLPEVYDDYSGADVITMEFIDGKKCDGYMASRNGKPDSTIANRLYELYLDMAFNSRLLHVDMHAGNILIDGDGKIVLLDTGLVHRLPAYYSRRYIRTYLCAAAADGYLQVENYFGGRKHMLSPNQRQSLARDLHAVYQSFHADQSTDFTLMWVELLNALRKNGAQLDREFVMVTVADMTMAGMARQFDPDFDVVENVSQALPKLIFDKQKLALNDPFLMAALRPDLVREMRSAIGEG